MQKCRLHIIGTVYREPKESTATYEYGGGGDSTSVEEYTELLWATPFNWLTRVRLKFTRSTHSPHSHTAKQVAEATQRKL